MEKIGPDKDVIAITNKILEQNDLILRMNADLLKRISSPLMFCETTKLDPKHLISLEEKMLRKGGTPA